ncbi:hypothetical protein C8R46DRAFT_1226528 [Mycena filopes]|nr:hypothetical protein C8R46DRAFT_1226528 [Mycena filopes]
MSLPLPQRSDVLRNLDPLHTHLFLSNICWGWPAFVIGGHILLQSAAWVLFAHSLFTCGISRSISLRLRRPMSLTDFVSTVTIAQSSFVLPARRWKWSAVSLVVLELVFRWSTFLTPVNIVIKKPLIGTELDLGSTLLAELQGSGNAGFQYCRDNSGLTTAFTAGQADSGYATAKEHMNYSASFTSMNQNFNISTDTTPSLRVAGATNPNATWDGVPIVDVLRTTEIRSNCSLPVNVSVNFAVAYTRSTVVSHAPNYLMMLACPGAAEHEYSLILQSGGRYTYGEGPTMVCTLAPKLTQVNTEYTDPRRPATAIQTTTLDAGPDSGLAGLAAAIGMVHTVYLVQGGENNIMGDAIIELLADFGDNATIDLGLELTAAYIRGVAEYSVSTFRACLSAQNGTFGDGVPANMTTPTTGTIFIQTMGWTRFGGATRPRHARHPHHHYGRPLRRGTAGRKNTRRQGGDV